MASMTIDRRAKLAQRYKLLGHSNKEIAEMMGISVRTVGRYLHHEDLEESGEEEMVVLPPALRDEYIERARPQLLGTIDDIEQRRLEGKLSNRDLILLAQMTFTNLARLSPPEEKDEPKGEGTTFVLQTRIETIEEEVQKRLKELQEAEGIIEGEVIERTLEN